MNKTNIESIMLRLDKLYRDLPLEYAGYVLTAIQDIEQIVYYDPYAIGRDLYRKGAGISDIWSALSNDEGMDEARDGFIDASVGYSPEYDAYYDKDTLEWKESKCDDPECDMCPNRPAKAP